MPDSDAKLTFKVPGRPAPPRELESEVRRRSAIKVKRSVAVRKPIRGEADWQTIEGVAPTDVIELEFGDGVRRYTRADQLAADIRATQVSRGDEDQGAIVVPATLGGAETRGFVQLFLNAFQVMEVPTPEEVLIDRATEQAAQKAATAIAAYFESELRTGLFRIGSPSEFIEQVTAPLEHAPSKPILLFLHGTASSTAGSFSGLEGKEEWTQFKGTYDHILALEHCTLSLSPIDNAIAAARLLPRGARLHMVSHSRGGLVGELLCAKRFRKDQIAAFESSGRKDQADLLRQLDDILRDRELVIEKFVRVACPSRGTLLASDRLDLYFSLLLEVLRLVPAIAASPVYPIVKSALLALIAEKATPRTVPGIEAQRPESPFIALLNRSDLETQADLAIIAGRTDYGGSVRSLVKLASDAFYLEPNDFVVNTEAMYGGMLRQNGAWYFADRGGDVSHFQYFKNDRTRQQVGAWLRGETNRSLNLFVDLQLRKRKDLMFPEWRAAEEDTRPVVIYVPPLLGTYLGTVWLHAPGLIPGDLDRLADPQLAPEGVVPHRCGRLLKQLSSAFAIKPFAYDWRQPLDRSADRLAELLSSDDIRKAQEAGRPIRILAFSSGGMLVHRLAQKHPSVWNDFVNVRGSALLLGDLAVASECLRELITEPEHPLTQRLALIDGRDPANIRDLFAGFEGLRDAAAFSSADVPAGVSYVFGFESPTASAVAWYARTGHGNLADNPASFAAIGDLLARGRTDSLARKPYPKPSETHPPVRPLFPTEEDLFDAAFQAVREEEEQPITLDISVTHGHLREARYPVAVGHYLGDGIVSAEKVIDDQLLGRLSNRFALGLYPGEAGTAEAIEAPDFRPPGALVIGFGEVGKITPEVVRRGIAAVAERHALQQLEVSTKAPEEVLETGITSVLLATYGGNALSVRNSIAAVVDGVIAANRALGSLGLGNRVRICSLEFIELYEDLAIQAARELVDLEARFQNNREGGVLLRVTHTLNTAPGGRFHRPYNPYEFGWWRRIEIVENDDPRHRGEFRFTVLTDRARAELSVEVRQQGLVNAYIQEAIADTHYDEELSVALFELLLPNDLKDQMRDKANVIWVVDDRTSEYPWELLAQRTRGSVERLSSTLGMLRQFVSPDYRRNPRNCREKTAFVVGDPVTSLRPLPEARREAEEVSRVLEAAGYAAPPLLGADATARAIGTKLFARDYRILHLAGHGQYHESPTQRGMIIGDGKYLTAAELTKLRVLPELVFLNCCHLGRGQTEDDKIAFRGREVSRLAGSVAKELINMGVKAVIAAGWAVDDDAAITFATEFYRAMLNDGEKFGIAVDRARRATADRHPSSNTAGAYQCYGNPDFSLAATQPSSADTDVSRPVYVARQEYLDRLKSIQSTAKGATPSVAVALGLELKSLEEGIPTEWLDGEILAAFGAAYGELERFGEAIAYYERALADPNARGPVVAAQQVANLLCREAAKLPPEQADERLKRARQWLDWAVQLGRSPERLSVIGSHYKKLTASTDEARRDNFAQALKYYEEANELAVKDTGRLDTYSKINALGLRLILNDFDPEMLRREADAARLQAIENAKDTRSVWDRVGEPDAQTVIYALSAGEKVECERLVARYRDVLSFASPREKDSVLTQLKFLKGNLTGEPQKRINEILAGLN